MTRLVRGFSRLVSQRARSIRLACPVAFSKGAGEPVSRGNFRIGRVKSPFTKIVVLRVLLVPETPVSTGLNRSHGERPARHPAFSETLYPTGLDLRHTEFSWAVDRLSAGSFSAAAASLESFSRAAASRPLPTDSRHHDDWSHRRGSLLRDASIRQTAALLVPEIQTP